MANITQIDLGAITPIPKGDYSLTTNYERLNLVVYNGSSWIRTDIEPYVVGSIPQTGSLYWQLNASGVSEIPDASLIVKGITKLSNATNSVDETVAATSRAVKSAYDIGSTAVSNATTANNKANSALSIANTAKAVTDKVSTTPAAGKIPLAGSDGKIDKDWMDWSAWNSGLAGKADKSQVANLAMPDFSRPINVASETAVKASYDGYLCIILAGSFMNWGQVAVGTTSNPTRVVFKAGDDINGNTKHASGFIPIPKGMYFKYQAFGEYPFEFIELTFYPSVGAY